MERGREGRTRSRENRRKKKKTHLMKINNKLKKHKNLKTQDLALITVDERSPGIFDVYRLDLATGKEREEGELCCFILFWGERERRRRRRRRGRQERKKTLSLSFSRPFPPPFFSPFNFKKLIKASSSSTRSTRETSPPGYPTSSYASAGPGRCCPPEGESSRHGACVLLTSI